MFFLIILPDDSTFWIQIHFSDQWTEPGRSKTYGSYGSGSG
jgi:hypothetical protein